jgi:hypothetical protein
MRPLIAPALLAALLGPVAGSTAESLLDPLAFLAGHCWTTVIDGGRERDTHCYEWVHDGMHLRDRHVVRGDKPEYRGETLYAWNGDGHLWVMTGPINGETRTTPATPLADGRSMRLRFTRFNVQPDRFESRMEVSFDGGSSWMPGNHQVFTRGPSAGGT